MAGVLDGQMAARKAGYRVRERHPLVPHLGVVLDRHQVAAVAVAPEDAAHGPRRLRSMQQAGAALARNAIEVSAAAAERSPESARRPHEA